MINIIKNGFFYGIVLVIAIGLKYHYSRANSDDLEWILRPTAIMVEQVSGIPFEREASTGYVNREHGIIIAPSRAGLNFYIIAFCMVVFSYSHLFNCLRLQLLWLGGSMLGTYLLTLTVNTFRIVVALHVYDLDLSSPWLTQERLHRLEGIIVYFVFLCTFYLILQKVLRYYVGGKNSNSFLKGRLPFFWYALITLVVPLVRSGAHREISRVLEHGGFVFIVCLTIMIGISLIQLGYRRIRQHIRGKIHETTNFNCRR